MRSNRSDHALLKMDATPLVCADSASYMVREANAGACDGARILMAYCRVACQKILVEVARVTGLRAGL